MQPLTVDEIRAAFVNCSKGEAKRLPMPKGLDDVDWEQIDFLGHRDQGAPNAPWLVAPWRGELVGLVLRVGGAARGGRANMCELCTTTHYGSDIALMAAPRAGKAGRDGNTVGTYLCADLACSLYARGRLKPGRVQPEETLTTEAKVERLQGNLDTFVRRVVQER